MIRWLALRMSLGSELMLSWLALRSGLGSGLTLRIKLTLRPSLRSEYMLGSGLTLRR